MNTVKAATPYNASGVTTLAQFRAIVEQHARNARATDQDDAARLARIEVRTEIALDLTASGAPIKANEASLWAQQDAADILGMESEYFRAIALCAVSYQCSEHDAYHEEMKSHHPAVLTMAALSEWNQPSDDDDEPPRVSGISSLPNADASRVSH